MTTYQTNSTKEELERWYEALRSGEYKQGTQNLCNLDEEFCCLGVYHDVNGDEDWETGENGTCWSAGKLRAVNLSIISTVSMLPVSVMPYDIQLLLSYKNDRENMSLRQIADWAEPRLLPK